MCAKICLPRSPPGCTTFDHPPLATSQPLRGCQHAKRAKRSGLPAHGGWGVQVQLHPGGVHRSQQPKALRACLLSLQAGEVVPLQSSIQGRRKQACEARGEENPGFQAPSARARQPDASSGWHSSMVKTQRPQQPQSREALWQLQPAMHIQPGRSAHLGVAALEQGAHEVRQQGAATAIALPALAR